MRFLFIVAAPARPINPSHVAAGGSPHLPCPSPTVTTTVSSTYLGYESVDSTRTQDASRWCHISTDHH